MKKTIFLVDDDMTNLKVGRNTLAKNYQVLLFSSGAEMLETIKIKKPDLILLDIDMPKMDGYEVFKKLKSEEATAKIPVIFLTALNDKQSVLDGLSIKPQGYITKPFSTELLLSRVQEYIY